MGAELPGRSTGLGAEELASGTKCNSTVAGSESVGKAVRRTEPEIPVAAVGLSSWLENALKTQGSPTPRTDHRKDHFPVRYYSYYLTARNE